MSTLDDDRVSAVLRIYSRRLTEADRGPLLSLLTHAPEVFAKMFPLLPHEAPAADLVYVAVSSYAYYPEGAEDVLMGSRSLDEAIEAARKGRHDYAEVVEVELTTGRVAIVFKANGKTEDHTRRERHGGSWWTPEARLAYLKQVGLEEGS